MTREKLFKLIDIDRLPTLPAIAVEAMRVMEGEKATFQSVGDLLRNDQVLSSRLLRYANSAFTGMSNIREINKAISVLGFNAVRSIILSSSIFDTFSPKNDHEKKGLVNFWIHTIAVAETAEVLGRRLNFAEPDMAHLAGLLHDLGKLILYCQFPEKFTMFCDALSEQSDYSVLGEDPLKLEERILGANHLEAGKFIAELWKFPEAFVRTMAYHHQPVYETIMPDEDSLPMLIRFADVLCVSYRIGSSYFLAEKGYSHEAYHHALENIMIHHHFSSRELDEMMEGVAERVKTKGSFLGFWDENIYRDAIHRANSELGDLSLGLDKDNRKLSWTNRVLEAIRVMTNDIKPSLLPSNVAERIILVAAKTFTAPRGLCLVLDAEDLLFQGYLFEGKDLHKVSLPANKEEMMQDGEQGATADMKGRTMTHLRFSSKNNEIGRFLAESFVDALASGRLLSSFFSVETASMASGMPVIGHLAMDMGMPGECAWGVSDDELQGLFQTFVLAAAACVERMLLHARLEKQAVELAQASRKMEENQRVLFHSHRLATVGRLAAGAAHEINNPLTIISLNIQLLERIVKNIPDNNHLIEKLHLISSQEERISKIIRDLLGFAKPAEPQFQSSSLAEILDTVLNALHERIALASITVRKNMPQDLPMVLVDPKQVEQVFMNLVINAIHAMKKGGTLTLGVRASNDFVETVVEDTGHGIAQKYLGRIFDPFFTTKKEGEGTGLGLAISNSIVEHNGGSIRVRSQEGKGTTFNVIFPVDKAGKLRAIKKTLALNNENKGSGKEQKGKYSILVIDDEELINKMLQESLRNAGFDVDGVYDGVEGIGKLRYKQYHCLLLDIRMPRKDGMEVLHFVREACPDIKVIIITGQVFKKEVQETLTQGVVACLGKPFKVDELLMIIKKALNDKGKADAFHKSKGPASSQH